MSGSIVLSGDRGTATLTSSLFWGVADKVLGACSCGVARALYLLIQGCLRGSQWSCGHVVRCWAGQRLWGDIPGRQGWHILTLEPRDVVGMIHSDIWGQLAKSWVRWAGAGGTALEATSTFFLGTWSPRRWLGPPASERGRGYSWERQRSFSGFGVMKLGG